MRLAPSPFTRRSVLKAVTALAGNLVVGSAWADAFPSRPVKILLPQPPGGAADRLARIFGEHLQAGWKQPVVIENRPGGGVVIGTLATARAAPDGYTLGLLGSSLTINAVQRKDLPYDTLKDLQPVARVGYYTVALVAESSFPANDVKELIALAKPHPGKFQFGSNGIGTSAQLAGEMLNHMAGIQLTHVPYNGASKMYTDIIGGQLPLGFSVASSAETFVKSGQLKVLGVTSRRRSDLYPQWPAIAETLPGYEAVNWAGFAAPAGLPHRLLDQIAADLLAVLSAPEVAKAMAEMGIDVSPMGPAEFRTFIQDEMKRFAEITKPLTRSGN
ncbi:tripartite tricarboxylate transporter substrate binding protein [Variovorax sp. J2P1-59]|uniref:Bug family tripartite tricarboxylate transporter substrate binding protein n=1 Tax=Variovorax flavidus TaxID=3053501 RepID=UPI0025782588|nr:tripartite tricarboxylate transporter substrate binding protein [Variovorax sp. J2P1-59]MDM0078792.1 tripartite tricarboxylate transporter substrate binding protein [Variovorax sp. J2P1-59]